VGGGGGGGAVGAADEVDDVPPPPTALIADTLNVYVVPFTSGSAMRRQNHWT